MKTSITIVVIFTLAITTWYYGEYKPYRNRLINKINHSMTANNYALDYMLNSAHFLTRLKDSNRLDSLDLVEVREFCKYADSSLVELEWIIENN